MRRRLADLEDPTENKVSEVTAAMAEGPRVPPVTVIAQRMRCNPTPDRMRSRQGLILDVKGLMPVDRA